QVEVPDPTPQDPGQTKFVPQQSPHEIARIGFNSDFGSSTTLSPRNSTFTADGTRLYVALYGVGGIAVIDTVALQEIDTNPNIVGVQHIELPGGARPFDVVAEPGGRYLYVSDEANP